MYIDIIKSAKTNRDECWRVLVLLERLRQLLLEDDTIEFELFGIKRLEASSKQMKASSKQMEASSKQIEASAKQMEAMCWN